MPIFDGSIDVVGEADRYEVSLAAGVTYYFELLGGAADDGDLTNGFLTLYRSGVELASDNNGGVGLDARLVFTPRQSGIYHIDATGVGRSTGSYNLLAFQDDYRNTLEGTGSIGLLNTGGALRGTIDYRFPSGLSFATDRDVFRVSLIAGLSYQFELRGSDRNGGTLESPQLLLFDRDGILLSAPFLNPDDIAWSPLYTGTHYVVADTPRFSGDTGTYRLVASAGTATDGVDFVLGTSGPDAIDGLAGRDEVRGGGGADLLRGGRDSDVLMGQAGDDTIIGGALADLLVGGSGFDTFRFEAAADSRPPQHDLIRGGNGAPAFESAGRRRGDIIDLSRLDADTIAPGDQDFSFGGTGRGHLRCVDAGERTVVLGNTDNDRAFEFKLIIADAEVDASDYSRADFIF